MKKAIAILSLAGLLAAQSTHAFNVTFFAGLLQDENGDPLANGRQLLIVADADGDGFGDLDGPLAASATAFLNDVGDQIIGDFVMDDNTTGEPGKVFTTFGFTLGNNGVTVGDQFALVWYSAADVSSANAGPGFSKIYGFYTDSSWLVPGSDGDDVSATVDEPSLQPNFITQAIPEPTTGLLVAISAMSLAGLFRRRK